MNTRAAILLLALAAAVPGAARAAEAKPKAEAKQKAEAKPKAEVKPKADAKPRAEAKLKVDQKLKLGARGQNAIARVTEVSSVLAHGAPAAALEPLRSTGVKLRVIEG